MNMTYLEAFAVDFALNLAGWTLNTSAEGFEALSASQVAVATTSAVSAYAKTRPDYNLHTDISNIIQIAVQVYAEAVQANVITALEALEATQAKEAHALQD